MYMRIGHFTAWITIDGVKQTQYSIEYSPDGTLATCWIASQAGKNFSVVWQDSLRAYPSSGHVSVDGIQGSGLILYGPKLHNGGISTRKGFMTSATTNRRFMFSELELTDDDEYLQKGASPELGEIKLVIHQCQVLGFRPTPRYDFAEPEKIHERSKKAMGHRCKLGPEIQTRKVNSVATRHLEKLATFVFIYRPLGKRERVVEAAGDVIDLCQEDRFSTKRKQDRKPVKAEAESPENLQANGTAPLDRKRKRTVKEATGDFIDLSQNEHASYKCMQEERKPVKAEHGLPRVKREAGGSRGRVQHLGFIDLT